MAFSHRPKLQEGNLFTMIPTEIRLMILRIVLVRGPLEDRDKLGYDEYCQQVQSTNVLLACRTMYDEGTQILYNENILSIRVVSPELDYIFVNPEDSRCHILNGSFDIPRRIQDVHEENSRIIDITKNDGESGPHWIHRRYSDLMKFKRIELNISLEDPEYVYVCCQVLAPLLKGKKVTLRPMVDTHSDSDSGVHVTTEEDEMPQHMSIRACQALRCESFEVIGIGVPMDVRALIQSNTPVPQTFEKWIQFHQILREAMDFASTDDTSFFFDGHIQKTLPVYTSMFEFDEDSFHPLLGCLAQTAIRWTRSASIAMVQKIEGCMEDFAQFVEAAEGEAVWWSYRQ